MTDSYEELHKRVLELTERAELECKLFPHGGGSLNEASSLFREASELEKRAFDAIPLEGCECFENSRLRGVTAIRAVSLLLRSGDAVGASKLASEFLDWGLPEFAVVELRSFS